MKALVPTVGIIAWALLGGLAVSGTGPSRVEARVQEGVESALADAGMGAIETRVDGRTVTLVGTTPSEAERESLLGLAASVPGVRGPVIDRVVLVEPEPDPEPEPPAVLAGRACQERFDAALTASRIEFMSGSALVRQRSYPLLAELAEIATSCPEAQLAIEGHTDWAGPDDVNQRMSEARAQAVADYLIGAGVSELRIVVIGHGESQPVQSNRTEAGRAANRRIEVNVRDLEPSAP